MSSAAVALSSSASTTLLRPPDLIAATAVATARCHSGVVRLPSAQRTPVGVVRGAGTGRPANPCADAPREPLLAGLPRPAGSLAGGGSGMIVVSHAAPSA